MRRLDKITTFLLRPPKTHVNEVNETGQSILAFRRISSHRRSYRKRQGYPGECGTRAVHSFGRHHKTDVVRKTENWRTWERARPARQTL